MPRHYLHPLLDPASVAVIGASEREDALGRHVMANLLARPFTGTVLPVNPRHARVMGLPCHPDLKSLPEVPDLAVIATPADAVAGLVADAGAAGVKHVLVLSAGFAERGEEGRARASRVRAAAARHGVRILGPNSAGVMRPATGFDASYSPAPARPGALALVSQSGAVTTAILDWAATTEIGFSSVVSLGGAMDLDFGEILDFLVHDPATKSILLYIDGIRDARGFMAALRLAARAKPVVVFKSGRHAADPAAATTHTGALTGSDQVFDAALARAGAVRVQSSLQLFAAARILAAGRHPRGPRLAVLTNGDGPGRVAADCAGDSELVLPPLSAAAIAKLDQLLPPWWVRANPVDLFGNATAATYAGAAEALMADEGIDAVLALFCPQAVARPEDAAEAVVAVAKRHAKPLITAWLGGASIQAARRVFEAAEVANFMTPENAVDALAYLDRFRRHQSMLLEAPPAHASMTFHEASQAVAKARVLREAARAEGRVVLTEGESKSLVAAFGIPVNAGRVARDREAALAAAREIGYPVAVKVHGAAGRDKHAAGGVRLGLATARQVGRAWDEVAALADPPAVLVQKHHRHPHQRELLVGISRDPVFGPVIAFGAGGTAVEVMRDIALALPPLNPTLAGELVQATRAGRLVAGYRDVPPADADALVDVLLRVSMMACLLPWIRALDLNPLLLHAGGAVAVDARVEVDHEAPITDLRYRHMAIFPYPVELEREVRLKDGTVLVVRPIRPDDADRERAFVAAMSDASRYARFQHPVVSLSDEMIARFTQLDYARDMALVAIVPADGRMAGVARYFPNPDRLGVEFAVAVADDWQGRGLGSLLMRSLIDCARDAGYTRMEGSVLASNLGMLALTDRLGFAHERGDDPGHTVRAVLAISQAGPA